jgi:Spy/CpxP family protein refolding chaperone
MPSLGRNAGEGDNDMKKRNVILIASILAVGALAVAPLVLAGPHGHGPGGFGMLAHLRHAKEELDLTDAQVAELRGIFREMREANAASREQLHGGVKEAAEILLADPGDVAAAQAALERRAAAERALKSSVLQSAAKALAVLDAEQRAKLRTMIEERHARRFGR